MLVYLAGPIDGTTQIKAKQWRETLQSALKSADINSYSPAHAFSWPDVGVDPTPLIEINAFALKHCNAVYARIPAEVNTVGTWMEIAHAHRLSIPVVLETNLEGNHLYLSQFIVVDNMEKGIRKLVELRGTD